MTTKKKTKKVAKKVHKHRWLHDGDSCWVCGAYEASCKGCDTVGMFQNGKLIDTTS